MEKLHVHLHEKPSKDFERLVLGKLNQLIDLEESNADVLTELLDLAERTPQIVFTIGPVAEQE